MRLEVGFGSEIILWESGEWGKRWTVGELAMGQSRDWSDGRQGASAIDEFSVGQEVVDLLVGMDVPFADVHAQVDCSVDLSRGR